MQLDAERDANSSASPCMHAVRCIKGTPAIQREVSTVARNLDLGRATITLTIQPNRLMMFLEAARSRLPLDS